MKLAACLAASALLAAFGCDAGGGGPAEAASAGEPDAAVAAPDPLRQATASATLTPLAGAGDVSGSATLVATATGVDLLLVMRGCSGLDEKPVRILEARSCAGLGTDAATWDRERGAGIPGVLCTSGSSGEGFVRYSRRHELADSWTLGDGSSHDVVGHAIALFDPATSAPTACGVIERAADRALVATPPASEAPSADARAALAGGCLARLMAGAAGGGCFDAARTSACASEHCELGACLQQCASFTRCLDAAPDVCAASFGCEVSAECAACQAQVTQCTFGFCAAEIACPAIPRPDGPCSSLFACCTLQGERAGLCLDVATLSASLGGEATCINGLTDWDVLSHLHVPCDTAAAVADALAHPPGSGGSTPASGPACVTEADCDDGVCVGAARTAQLSSPGRCQRRAETPALEDHVVGSACGDDAACGEGRCASATPLRTPYPEGYCTGRCYDDATCGAGAVCVHARGSTEPGHCYRSCAQDAECGRAQYRCTPLGDGERVVHGCHPRGPALPDGVVGAACASDADCGDGAASCRDGLPLSFLADEVVPAPGGYCSAACLFDEDCGQGAQCISGGPPGGQCMAHCDEARPCRDGYRCVPHMRDADDLHSVCMPIWDARDGGVPDAER